MYTIYDVYSCDDCLAGEHGKVKGRIDFSSCLRSESTVMHPKKKANIGTLVNDAIRSVSWRYLLTLHASSSSLASESSDHQRRTRKPPALSKVLSTKDLSFVLKGSKGTEPHHDTTTSCWSLRRAMS